MIEVCVDSVDSAIKAQEGGADRLEVCSNLIIGGTTPPIALIRGIRQHVHLPIHVLVRPRHGDFCYSDYEYEDMKAYIEMLRMEDVQGVVIGLLREDGTLHKERMEELIKLARPMYITFHRAFDMMKDPYMALEELIGLQVDCILTSGQRSTAYEGRELIRELILKSQGRIDIMPGGGVSPVNYRDIKDYCGNSYMHFSAKREVKSKMTYRREGLTMGQQYVSEYIHYMTDEGLVSAIRELDKQ